MAPGRQILACLALLTIAVAILGCGGSDERELEGEPFSQQERNDYTNALEAIGTEVDGGDCSTAQSKLTKLTIAVNEVPPERDEGLKTDLLDLLGQLGDQIDSDCQEAPDKTTTKDTTEEPVTPPPTTTIEPPPTPTPTSTSTQETTTEKTTTTESTTTTTVPEDPGTEPPPTPPGQGGSGPGGGTGGTAPGKAEKKLKAGKGSAK